MGLTGGNALIGQFVDNIDELLKRSGQVPKIGAGTSQPPPANPAPSRFGASALTAPAPAQPALPQAQTVGAPGGTAPFMPAKIGASPQPAMPSSPKIGAGIDTYDPSQSPMPAGGHDYAAEYAAVHDPTPLSPDAGKPSMLRKIGGIATGAAIGAFNPQAGAKIGASIVGGPRNELMRNYNQQEGLANQQRERISKEAGLADTGSQVQQRQAQAAKDNAEAANVGNPKPVPAEVGHTYVDDKGNEVGVMKDGSTKVLGPAQGKSTGSFEEKEYDEWAAPRKAAGKPFDRMTFEKEKPSGETTAARLALAQGNADLARQRLSDQQQKTEEAQRQFSPAIAQQVVQGMTTQASTRRLLQILEPYKNDNTPWESFMKTMEYKLGRAQTDEIGQELAALNLTSLQQAGSVIKGMGGVRSVQVLDKVLEHTPDPKKDSIKLMYDKMKNIDRTTSLFLQDADKYGRKSGAEIPASSMTPYNAPTGQGSSGPPGPPADGMKWQQNVKTGAYRQVPVTK